MGKGYAEHENDSSHSAERPDVQTRQLFEEAPRRPPVPIPPLLGGERTQEPRGACPMQSHVHSRWLCAFGPEKQGGAAPGTPAGADAALQEPGLCSVHGAGPASFLPPSAPENLP